MLSRMAQLHGTTVYVIINTCIIQQYLSNLSVYMMEYIFRNNTL